MRNYLGFVLGIVVGLVGLLCAQRVLEPATPSDIDPTAGKGQNSLAARRDAQLLADARDRIANLEGELAAARKESVPEPEGGAEAPEFAGDGDGEEQGKPDEAQSFLEALASFGDKGTERKIDKEVERLTGLLGLSEDQQQIARKALAQKAADQKAAGIKMITGRATIDDLVNSDEHNYSAVDAAMMGVLGDEQLAAYAEVQEEREINRVQKKAEEELEELAGIGELTEEQSDAAWEVFVEVNAGEKPGEIPEGISNEEFMGIVDDSLASRVEGLRPILNEKQFETYQEQVGDFRDVVTTLIGHATGGAEE